MFRLAHISDVHLGPLPPVTYRQLASKRITGYVNWQRTRSKTFHAGALGVIVADMLAAAPDHTCVTGDLMNLALGEEIVISRKWLETLGAPQHVSVVPGNHDAYVPGALRKACEAWRPWTVGEHGWARTNSNGFPYVRVRDRVAVIGVSSARASAPFLATGSFTEEQGRRLGRILDRARDEGLCRVIMIHHPPVRGADPAHKRLYGISTFQKVIRRHGAEIVLHGHTHLPTLNWIPGAEKRFVPVVGVAAAGESIGHEKPLAQYNLVELSQDRGEWRLDLTRRGLAGPTGLVVQLSRETLIEPARRAPATA
jgi:3',5'-cyclic AMP phosphodiesterase CpdA